MENDLIKRGVIFNETINVFRDIKYYDDDNKQTDGKEKCANKFSKYVPVQLSHYLDIQYFTIFCSSLSEASCRAIL